MDCFLLHFSSNIKSFLTKLYWSFHNCFKRCALLFLLALILVFIGEVIFGELYLFIEKLKKSFLQGHQLFNSQSQFVSIFAYIILYEFDNVWLEIHEHITFNVGVFNFDTHQIIVYLLWSFRICLCVTLWMAFNEIWNCVCEQQ